MRVRVEWTSIYTSNVDRMEKVSHGERAVRGDSAGIKVSPVWRTRLPEFRAVQDADRCGGGALNSGGSSLAPDTLLGQLFRRRVHACG